MIEMDTRLADSPDTFEVFIGGGKKSYDEIRYVKLRKSAPDVDFVLPVCSIPVSKPATILKVFITFSTLAEKISGSSAEREKSFTCKITSFRSILLSRLASSRLNKGRPEKTIMQIKNVLKMCFVVTIIGYSDSDLQFRIQQPYRPKQSLK